MSKSHLSLLNVGVHVDKMDRYQKPEVISSIPNLPSHYAKENNIKDAWKSDCGKHPSIFDISFSNDYWQVHYSTNGTFYLFNAFFDNRTLVKPKPVIRILAMINRIKPTVSSYCHVWYEGKINPLATKVVEYKYIWIREYGNYKQGILQPYLITCNIPTNRESMVPISVSLVENRCDKSTNNLRVINNVPTHENVKKNFAVCVKGLDFSQTDRSVEIIEWLEMLFLVGANKVFLYDLGVHPNITKVLNYYKALGKVEVSKLSLPGNQPNAYGLLHMYLKAKITHKRQNELIPYNDCLYKNMNMYKFIVLLDTDEFIMPRSFRTWHGLLKKIAPEVMLEQKHYIASFHTRNVYFLDEMQEPHTSSSESPKFMKILRNVYRAANYTKPGHYAKCFHDPQLILTLHNHFPFSCLGSYCKFQGIHTDDAHLQHYRHDCVGELSKSCLYFKNHTVKDTTVNIYKKDLIKNVINTLKYLEFLKI